MGEKVGEDNSVFQIGVRTYLEEELTKAQTQPKLRRDMSVLCP